MTRAVAPARIWHNAAADLHPPGNTDMPGSRIHALVAAAAVAAASLLLPGCGPRDAEPAPEPQPQLPPRAETTTDTLYLEGMPEVVTLTLVRSPADARPGFSTYVPPGIETDVDAAGDSASVRFSAAFSGSVDPNAYMHVRLYPLGTGTAVAGEVVAGFMRSRRPQDDPTGDAPAEEAPHHPTDVPAWGTEAHVFSYADGDRRYVGRVVIGQHGPQSFHVLTHYPAEYGDGLGPRFEQILRHWRWEDSGAMLVDGRSGAAGAASTPRASPARPRPA